MHIAAADHVQVCLKKKTEIYMIKTDVGGPEKQFYFLGRLRKLNILGHTVLTCKFYFHLALHMHNIIACAIGDLGS